MSLEIIQTISYHQVQWFGILLKNKMTACVERVPPFLSMFAREGRKLSSRDREGDEQVC